MPRHIGAAWKSRFGVDILDGLGSTEMLHIFLSNAPGDVAYGTSGRAVPGYELRLLDEAGKAVGDDEVGELYVRGPTAADSYWNQRDKSRRTFQGEWTRTGDVLSFDEAGLFWFAGRNNDLFKVRGLWIEAALTRHRAVREAAVVSFDDADGLTRPRAFVAPRDGFADSPGLIAELQREVAPLGSYKIPASFRFVDGLPRTTLLKIDRKALRE